MTNGSTTNYSIFEHDQVLTHDQLNSLVGYTDEQLRQSRVKLLGVGVLEGMRPRVVANSVVHVSAGVGVTTDGDLLHLAASDHTHYKTYTDPRSHYAPFESIPKIYELLRDGTDPQAKSLASLPELRAMVVLAYMESHVEDRDLCSGGGCDNLGRHARNNLLLLLLPAGSASGLVAAITTPHDAYDNLTQLRVGRPKLDSCTSTTQLASAYRSICSTASSNLYNKIQDLQKVDEELGPILNHAQPQAWMARLGQIDAYWSSRAIGIQYYYDLLKDLVDTWNGFREALFGDRGWLHTNPGPFPKHLLLGSLASNAKAEDHRMPWFPAPSPDSREHACMLLRKFGALLGCYSYSPSGGVDAIHITPSMFEDRCLEERAVPIYYPDADIIRDWSHAHRQRNSSSQIFSCHAAKWSVDASVVAPLGSQIGAFPFFRVEGHIGRTVTWALEQIRAKVQSANLPFSVQAIYLGSSSSEPSDQEEDHTDRRRMRDLLREDLVRQLDVIELQQRLRSKITAADAGGELAKAVTTSALKEIDEIIEARVEQHADQLRFGNYLFEHPGLEHFAGVTRGGTFVLVYDGAENVVADFMLPAGGLNDIQLGQSLRMLTPAGGDGQIGAPGETLKIALRVRISDGKQPIKDALVQFEVLGTMFNGEALDQWTGGCVHASFNVVKLEKWPGGKRTMRAVVKTDSDGIAQVQWVLGTESRLSVQRVRATLLDASMNRTSEQTLFTAHLLARSEVPSNGAQSGLAGIASALARLGLGQSSIVPWVVDTDDERHLLCSDFSLSLTRLAGIELGNFYEGNAPPCGDPGLQLAMTVWVGEDNAADMRHPGSVVVDHDKRMLIWTKVPLSVTTMDPRERRVIVEFMPSALGLPGPPLRWGFRVDVDG